MILALLLTAAAIIPNDRDIVRERCAVIEANFFYDENGRLVFCQHIFYELRDESEVIVAWRLVKQPEQTIERDWQRGGYRVAWKDGDVTRIVHAPSMRVTWTQYDVELMAREAYPKELRKELRKPRFNRKITGRGNANSRIPKHEQPVKEVAMSGNESSCAAPVVKSDAVEYRPIPGWPGYRAGTDGSVWSSKTGEWKELVGSVSKGYRLVVLSHQSRRRTLAVHRLILRSFAGECPAGCVACHSNDVRTDNRVCNLRWDTPVANAADKERNGNAPKGERNGFSDLTDSQIVEIRQLAAQGMTNEEIAAQFNCNYRNISMIVLGKSWRHVSGPIRASRAGQGLKSQLCPGVNVKERARELGITPAAIYYRLRKGMSIEDALSKTKVGSTPRNCFAGCG